VSADLRAMVKSGENLLEISEIIPNISRTMVRRQWSEGSVNAGGRVGKLRSKMRFVRARIPIALPERVKT